MAEPEDGFDRFDALESCFSLTTNFFRANMCIECVLASLYSRDQSTVNCVYTAVQCTVRNPPLKASAASEQFYTLSLNCLQCVKRPAVEHTYSPNDSIRTSSANPNTSF